MRAGPVIVHHYSQGVVFWSHKKPEKFIRVLLLVRFWPLIFVLLVLWDCWKFCLVLSLWEQPPLLLSKFFNCFEGKSISNSCGFLSFGIGSQTLTDLVALRCLQTYTYTYSSPPLSMGDMFQDLQWMPETMDNTKPYIYCAFPICIYLW